MVFPSRRSVIFVHGCFWHRHEHCKLAHQPKSRLEYWGPKFERNTARDRRNLKELEQRGWRVMIIWECELAAPEKLLPKIASFLGP